MSRPREQQTSQGFNADEARELAAMYHVNRESASRAQLPKVLEQVKKRAENGYDVVTVGVSADLPTGPLIEELKKRGFKAVITGGGYSTLEVSWK